MDRRHQIIKPGPFKKELLKLQDSHRSQLVWVNEDDNTALEVRRVVNMSTYKNIDDRIIPYLRAIGFYGVVSIGCMQIDHHLITALVERWRPETHTFHLKCGEATITLQDVQVLMGLPINGLPVTCGHVQQDYMDYCNRLLGVEPPKRALDGHKLKLSWLTGQFKTLPQNANIYTIQCYARALLLRIIGGNVFTTKNNNLVHLMWLPLLENLSGCNNYAWGAACLAWLYRELCKATDHETIQIAGFTPLVQMWAYERIKCISPIPRPITTLHVDKPYGQRWITSLSPGHAPFHHVSTIRLLLDQQKLEEMTWEPYKQIMDQLPNIDENDKQIWRSIVPLICFFKVEWHQPDRCLRQFGMNQPIPVTPYQDDKLHTIDLRGRIEIDWSERHRPFIDAWDRQLESVAFTEELDEPLQMQSQYMCWYFKHTRLWMTPTGAQLDATGTMLERIYHMPEEKFDSAVVREHARTIFGALNQEYRTAPNHPFQPVVPAVFVPRVEMPNVENRRRRSSFADRRIPIENPLVPENIEQVPMPMFIHDYGQIPPPIPPFSAVQFQNQENVDQFQSQENIVQFDSMTTFDDNQHQFHTPTSHTIPAFSSYRSNIVGEASLSSYMSSIDANHSGPSNYGINVDLPNSSDYGQHQYQTSPSNDGAEFFEQIINDQQQSEIALRRSTRNITWKCCGTGTCYHGN